MILNHIKNDVFTEEESEEIKAYKNFKPTELPDDIKQYLNKFNCQSTADIRKLLDEKQSWEEYYDREKHFDLDWIKHSVYTLKSLKRTIEDVNNHVRQLMGRRFDYLIREINPKSTGSLEFGASEVDKNYKLNGNKMIKKRETKLPKALKDMLDLLVKENKGDYSHLCTVGVVNSGLHMKVIIADRLKGYITRIADGKALQIPIDTTSFGEKVLPILVQVYYLKVLFKDTFESVKKGDNKLTDDCNWLDYCLDKATTIITCATSTSTETPRK
ncbi:MAG: hypothetical protein EXX96DRAFT_623795 [Benjaminiella poitrasii]|nr:MAG: hypothetical protein EXX96DRAFT_623795 [Benjaminiella poitrasii]